MGDPILKGSKMLTHLLVSHTMRHSAHCPCQPIDTTCNKGRWLYEIDIKAMQWCGYVVELPETIPVCITSIQRLSISYSCSMIKLALK